MNISGIRPSVGFYDKNSILNRPEIAASIGLDKIDKEATSAINEKAYDVNISEEGSKKFDAYDYANQYKPDETFEMKGVDSDIKSLDVEKAVSDMEKDSAIQQYQYFVSGKNPADAVAIASQKMENFDL